MPYDPLHAMLRHGFATKQLAFQDSKLRVNDNASRMLLREIGQYAGPIKLGQLLEPRPAKHRKAGPDEADVERWLDKIGRDEATNRLTYMLAQARLVEARSKIMAKYSEIGSYRSPLGLASDPDRGVYSRGGTYVMDFRGGHIEANPLNNDPAIAKTETQIQVWWVGLECRIRQEKVDELYGTVAALIPGSGITNTMHFPEDREYWDMGPDGQRITQAGVKLYEGPPMDITLIASLVEYDSGNIDKYKREVAEAIAKASQTLAPSVGVPAEVLAADQGFISDLSLGLVNAISSVLGADDDAYTPQQRVLHWTDLKDPSLRQTLQRSDDPRHIDYTHSIVVSGIDQGGDRGEYAFYFDIRHVSP